MIASGPISPKRESSVAQIGCGELESLLAAYARRVIDEVERLAPQDPAFRDALSNVWRRGMPDDVWIRVLAAAGRENEN
jgi:hypothetical protein